MFSIFKKKLERKCNEWLFDQPENCAVVTIRQVLAGDQPIQIIYHDIEDDGWQFLSHIEYTMDDVLLVSLEQMTKLDPTIFDVANMKPGYYASRQVIGDRWEIMKTPNQDNE